MEPRAPDGPGPCRVPGIAWARPAAGCLSVFKGNETGDPSMAAVERMLASSVAVAWVLLSTAPASADDCAPVQAAFVALTAAPAYRQTVTMPGMDPLESIVIGDTIYMRMNGSWSAPITLKAGGRLGVLNEILTRSGGLQDCSTDGSETVDGRPATVYHYVLPPIEGLGTAGPMTLYVGDDGLPLRLKADDGSSDQVIGYDDVTAPSP
jgi:hypothetical protein